MSKCGEDYSVLKPNSCFDGDMEEIKAGKK